MDIYSSIITFEEGKRYYGYCSGETGQYFITNQDDSLRTVPMFPFNHHEFREHFYTVSEYRELEINKIIDGDGYGTI